MIESAPLCVGHNITYDHDMVNIEFSRLNIVLNWPKLLCTIEQTMYLKGGRIGLTDLHIFLSVKASRKRIAQKMTHWHCSVAAKNYCVEIYYE